MAKPTPRDLTDPNDRWWTIDQAAAHFGYRRETIEKYIREGLKLHFTRVSPGYLDRDELMEHYRKRQAATRATRLKPTTA